MPNRVADILEDMHLIRKEWRSGSPWYEITHDRLIQPIKNSNKTWRYEIDLKKRSEQTLRLKIIIPIVAVVAVLSVIVFTSNYMTPSIPPVNSCQHQHYELISQLVKTLKV